MARSTILWRSLAIGGSLALVLSACGSDDDETTDAPEATEAATDDAGGTATGDGTLTVGTPTVEGAEVKGTVQGNVKGEKLIAYKYKRRQGYHRKRGHRQQYTKVRITGISV